MFPFVYMQGSVRIRTEEGPSLQICPEKRYPDDFEPYQSVDMEVEWRHNNTHQASVGVFF